MIFDILSATTPIFGLIALGYAIVRGGIVERDLMLGVGRIVLVVAMPALIFKAVSETSVSAIAQPHFLTAYGAGAVGAFVLIFGIFRIFFASAVTPAALRGMSASYPNSIYIGYPLIIYVFDDPPVAAFAMALLVENLILLPLCLIVMDVGSSAPDKGSPAQLAKSITARIIRNPLILAIVAGITASGFGLTAPGPIDATITLLAQAAPAMSLLFIGGVLVGVSLKGNRPAIATVAAGKLILHPLLVALAIVLLPDFDPTLQAAAILLAAAPMATILPLIGARYGEGPQTAVFLSVATIASFVTIAGVIWLVRMM
ncbi:MAG: AEC family transporter [Pseudomonadota bacterium]